jgi:hypothetical protein
VTPVSSSVAALSSPLAVPLGWPVASESMSSPRIGPNVSSWLGLPNEAGASPKSDATISTE